MAAKPFWPGTRAFGAGLLLCAAAGAAAARWWPGLAWAARELPRYASGRIGSPPERQWYREARELIRAGRDAARARELLERAVAVDPTCEAVLGLGEWHRAAGDDAQALAWFQRYVELDPFEVEAYLGAAESLERLGRAGEAAALLGRGRAWMLAERERQVPRSDPAVAARFNAKAIRVYQDLGESAARLERALARLAGVAPPGAP